MKTAWVGVCALFVAPLAGCGDDKAMAPAMDAGQADGSVSHRGDASGGVEDASPSSGGDGSAHTDSDAAQANCPPRAAGAAPTDYLTLFESGSRLEARYLEADGMPPVFVGFFDTALGVRCDFLKATDGTWRCMPRKAAVDMQIGYADDGCKTELFQASAACSAQAGYQLGWTECRDVYEARKLELLASSTNVYRRQNGTCTASGDTASPSTTTYATSAAVSPTAFVQGTLRDLPGVCQASVRVIEAEDGAKAPHMLFDVKTGFECDYNATARTSSCYPARRAYLEPSVFADASCTGEALSVASWLSAPSCDPPDLAVSGPDAVLYTLKGPYEGPAYSKLGACEPALNKAWIHALFALGPETSLAPLKTVSKGTARLQAYVMSETNTPLIIRGARDEPILFDTSRGEDCVVLPSSDGKYRCFPIAWSEGAVQDEYNDAACTQPVRRCSTGSCPGSILLDRKADPASCGQARAVTALWKVREAATDYYRKDTNGTCYAAGTPGTDMWQVDSLAWDDLGVLAERTAL